MDLSARLQQLEDMVKDAKSMPLSSSALLNREELLELLREMQEALPEEIKQARWVVKDREELLGKARHDAEAIVDKAHEEQLRLAKQEEIVARAGEEAERLLSEAEEEARRVRLEAEDYVDAKLAQFQIVLHRVEEELHKTSRALGRTTDQVQTGREKLRGVSTHPAGELAPEPEGPSPFSDEEEGG